MSRYSLSCLAAVLVFSACADAGAGIRCDAIGDPVPSVLGLKYERYAQPLPAILSQGEAERLAAVPNYASLSGKLKRAVKNEWRTTLKQLFDGTLPRTYQGGDDTDFDFLRGAAPNMLARLKACGPDADSRLSYLTAVPLKAADGDVE